MYLDTNDQYLFLDNFKTTIKIPVQDIEKVEMGFSGTNICYKTKTDPKEICNEKIHLWSPERIILLQGENFDRVKKTHPDDFSLLYWERRGESPSLFPFLEPGISVSIQTTSSLLKGTILDTEGKEVVFQETSGRRMTLDKMLIQKISLRKSSGFWKTGIHFLAKTHYAIPGLPQLYQGDTLKGSILLLLGLSTGLGSLSEWDQARKLSRPSYSFLPINNRLVLYQNPNAAAQQTRHINRSRALGVGFFLVLSYHIWDLWLSPTSAGEDSADGSQRNSRWGKTGHMAQKEWGDRDSLPSFSIYNQNLLLGDRAGKRPVTYGSPIQEEIHYEWTFFSTRF